MDRPTCVHTYLHVCTDAHSSLVNVTMASSRNDGSLVNFSKPLYSNYHDNIILLRVHLKSHFLFAFLMRDPPFVLDYISPIANASSLERTFSYNPSTDEFFCF